MKTKKQLTNRILSLVLALVMVLGMLPMTVSAASSGKCGDNITWNLSNDGTLTLSGSGVMYDKGSSDIPWYDQKGSIKKVVIENGITWIDQYSFYACNNLTQVVIHGNTKLSGYAFYGCGALTSVSYGGTVNRIEGSDAFAYCKKLSSFTLLEGVGKSGDAFFDCKNLSMKNVKLVDANGNDKTEYYTKTITINMATKSNPLTIKGNLAKGSIESIPDQQYTGGEVKPAVTVKWNGQTVSSSNYDVAYSNNIEPGTATVTVKGKDANYYTGTLTQTFTILEPEEMTSVSAQNVTATYDGNAHGITVTGAPADATITYSGAQDGTYTGTQPAIVNVADSGTIYYKVTAQGYKEFNGSASVTISPRNIADCQVQDISAQTYTGSVITPDVTVTYGNKTLTQDDYSIFGDSVNAGSGSVTITGKGNFEGTTTKYFQITTANIADTTITIDPENGTYTGNAYTPSVSVTFNGAPLVKDSDYILSWDKSGSTAPGTYTVRVVGIGNFTGYADKTFNISAANLTDVKVEQIGTLTYDGGNALTPTVSANAVAVNNQPITFTYSTEQNGNYGSLPSFTKAGTYTVYYKASAPNHNDATGSFTVTVNKAIVTEPTIASKPYTGSVQTADITDTDFYTVVENNGGTGVKLNGYYDVVLELKDAANYKWSSTNDARVTLKFEIRRATNEWTTTPSISGWTCGENANTPVGVAKFGDVSIQYIGTANDGTQINSTTAPTKAGSYTATFIVQETEDYKGLETSVDFTIAKADQAAPTGLTKTDTTYFGKADGKISGLTSAMEFRKEGDSTYTAGFNGTLEYLAAGTYYVRYQGDANHNPSPDAVVNVNDGRKLQIVVPQNQVGYTVTVNKTEMEYEGSYTLKVEIHEGYTATEDFKIIISNWECGQQAGVEETYMNAIADQIIEVRGVADITPPAAEIKVKENKWTSFWNNITFGLFFKETQDVRITANDKGVGVDAIYYYLADSELELDEVKAITDWQEYNGAFQINPNNRYVIYAKAVDKNGNTTYINSAKGIVLDSIAPVLYGIENGGVYHGDKIFKAVDDNFLKIEVDGVDVTDTTEGDDEYKIVADNAEHTVTVTDKAGNVTEIKITVYKRYMVTYTDGEGSSYEKEFNYGEVITIPTNEFFNDTFRRGGYTLTGWQGYTEGMTMPLSPVTLTALYKPKQYTVSFNANGGETIEPITVTFDEKYGNLPSSAIAGLSGGYKNWYLIDAYGNVTETNIKNLTLVTTARDHTLFIKRNVLAPNISITLAVPGGISDGYQYYIPGASQRVLTATVGNMNTDILDYAYKWYKDGALIEGATSNVLTLDGNVADSGTYKAEVTATLKDGTNIVVTSDTATASKEQKVKILHATNTISYDANGGEAGPQSSYTGGATLNVSKDVPTRTYYDFIGWNTKPDGSGDSYKADELYTFAEDNGNGGCVVMLYAQWKLVEYTVTYTADGQIIITEKVEHGKDATLTAVPAKDGHVGKWNSDGKNITGDTTITAVYTAIPVVKPNEVKPEDKTDLEDAKAKLEEELKDDSYTDDDKKNIQDAIDDIDDALEVIGNVETVKERISKLPAVDTVKPDDEEAIKAITDAKTAYNALSDYEKSLVDEAAKANLDKLVAALVAYDIVEGDGSSWTEDSNHNITFVVNGLFSKFVGIKVDGKDVDKANYEVKAGSTIITLKASYLDTLAVGEHTITVVYTDGSTDGTFNVRAKANSPATGDNSNMFLWIALLFISGGAVITLTVVDRKRRMASNR